MSFAYPIHGYNPRRITGHHIPPKHVIEKPITDHITGTVHRNHRKRIINKIGTCKGNRKIKPKKPTEHKDHHGMQAQKG